MGRIVKKIITHRVVDYNDDGTEASDKTSMEVLYSDPSATNAVDKEKVVLGSSKFTTPLDVKTITDKKAADRKADYLAKAKSEGGVAP